jgi:hypothetical protein
MKLRSTGLGETVLQGKLEKITQVQDYLVLHVQTIDPVQWHVRAAMDYNDLLTMVKLIIKGPVLKYIFSGLRSWKNPHHTDDF